LDSNAHSGAATMMNALVLVAVLSLPDSGLYVIAHGCSAWHRAGTLRNRWVKLEIGAAFRSSGDGPMFLRLLAVLLVGGVAAKAVRLFW